MRATPKRKRRGLPEVVGHTLTGWAVRAGDRIHVPERGSFTVVGRSGNLVEALHFSPGRRTFVGRTHGGSRVMRLHPSQLNMRSEASHECQRA